MVVYRLYLTIYLICKRLSSFNFVEIQLKSLATNVYIVNNDRLYKI
jgi:hypothetical protein